MKRKYRYRLPLLLLLGTLLLSVALNGYLLVAEPDAWGRGETLVPADLSRLSAELARARRELEACQQGAPVRSDTVP